MKRSGSVTDDISVVLPYKRLVELLEAASGMEDVRTEIRRIYDRLSALQLMITEALELFREYQD